MGNVNRRMETLRKKQKQMLDQKHRNTIEESFWWAISRLNTTEERFNKLENRSIETSQTEIWRLKKDWKIKTSKYYEQTSKVEYNFTTRSRRKE